MKMKNKEKVLKYINNKKTKLQILKRKIIMTEYVKIERNSFLNFIFERLLSILKLKKQQKYRKK